MYGFKITVTLAGEKPENLRGKLDEITDQLAIMSSLDAEFADFMVTRHLSGDTTFLIVVDGREDEVQALTAATSWLHAAVHAAGFSTPGWLKRAEQVFTEEEVSAAS
jgi:hypothetical protein